MSDRDPSDTPSRRALKGIMIALATMVFLPLVFQSRFRKLVALALLGIAYSSFLVSTWKRWMRRANRFNQSWRRGLGWLNPFRGLLKLIPFKAWGVVPCVIQLVVVSVIFVCGWFLGPVIYRVLRNPATPSVVRDALRNGAPEFFRFLSSLTSNQEPVVILRNNARQIFTSLNRFMTAIVFPLLFVAFSSIGASMYPSIERWFMQAEGQNNGRFSSILDRYSELFWEYIVLNFSYYTLLSIVLGLILGLLDSSGWTSFGLKLILGILVSFVAGNLVIPGLGTVVMSSLTVGMLIVETGWILGSLFLIGFALYFVVDDYLIKPWFLVWMGRTPGRKWEFGAEVIIFGLVILYLAFGIPGVLMLFPSLCFLSAYLENQYPTLRDWILQPIQQIQQ